MLLARTTLLLTAVAVLAPAAALAQNVATPLTYEECMARKTDLMDQAQAARHQALDLVMNWVGKYADRDAAVKLLDEKADELTNAAYSLQCIFHPDQPTTSNGGDTLKQLGGAADILRQAALSKEKLSVADYATSKARDLLTDKIEDKSAALGVLSKLTLSDPSIDGLIKDRLAELQAHTQAALSVLDKTGSEMQSVGKSEGTGDGGVTIDYSRIGSLGDPDKAATADPSLPGGDAGKSANNVGSTDGEGQAAAAHSTGYGSVSVDYTKMFDDDYKSAEAVRKEQHRTTESYLAQSNPHQVPGSEQTSNRPQERAIRQAPTRQYPVCGREWDNAWVYYVNGARMPLKIGESCTYHGVVVTQGYYCVRNNVLGC